MIQLASSIELAYRQDIPGGIAAYDEEDCTMESPFSHAQVREMFDYDASSGRLIWKIAPSNRIKPGDTAGQVAGNGRWYVGIAGRRHLLHRLIWLHQMGMWPEENVVPQNGDYLDTRIENLVSETAVETSRKGKLRSTNKSGVKGVSWNGTRKMWVVHVYRDYKTVCLGRFRELDDAVKCKLSADVGLFASDEDIAAAKARKTVDVRVRRVWGKMIKSSHGIHGWPSLDQFYADVGDEPQTNYVLSLVDGSAPIGPKNFQWVAPKFEGRIAAGKNVRAMSYDKYRDRQLQRTFGIGSAEYDAMVSEQNGVCAICDQPETALRRNKLLPLSVDHNHATGAVRGLLCTACNIGIGSLGESKDRLRAAIAYLEKWNAIEMAPLPDNVVKLKS